LTSAEGVGKTSIIVTLVSETFPRGSVSKTYHPVIISSDLYMLPINTSTVLLDSSCKPRHAIIALALREEEQNTDGEIERAHVIVLVYDVNNIECIKRLKSHWIPRILRINDKVRDHYTLHTMKIPIILVGNKVDLRSSQHDTSDLESQLNPYFLEYKQVEMGIECSAKGYMNLIDVVYCA